MNEIPLFMNGPTIHKQNQTVILAIPIHQIEAITHFLWVVPTFIFCTGFLRTLNVNSEETHHE